MAATRESAIAPEATAPNRATWYAPLAESAILPDVVIRWGIRRICAARQHAESAGGPEAQRNRRGQLIARLDAGPIAIRTDAANSQHYEVPAEFFQHVLGRHMKYSCGYWPRGVETLDASEEAMLALTAERARVASGQRILELGCGWGSLTLFLAERFPGCRITAVSNSRSQKEFIDAQVRARGFSNVEILTADMNDFDPLAASREPFDRIISVEMFEHMRNYRELFSRISRWMHRHALLFVHIFAHIRFAYPYEDQGPSDWMARHFFTGGMMPSSDLLPSFNEHVRCIQQWQLSGTHYQRTSNAWLARMDQNAAALLPVLARTYGDAAAKRWRQRWRIFFMACAELWGYRGGSEWIICHYLFESGQNNP